MTYIRGLSVLLCAACLTVAGCRTTPDSELAANEHAAHQQGVQTPVREVSDRTARLVEQDRRGLATAAPAESATVAQPTAVATAPVTPASPAVPALAPATSAPATRAEPARASVASVASASGDYHEDFWAFGGIPGIDLRPQDQIPVYLMNTWTIEDPQVRTRLGFINDSGSFEATDLFVAVHLGRKLTELDFNNNIARNAEQQRAFDLLKRINESVPANQKFMVGDADPRFSAYYYMFPEGQAYLSDRPVLLLAPAQTPNEIHLYGKDGEQQSRTSGMGFYVHPDKVGRNGRGYVEPYRLRGRALVYTQGYGRRVYEVNLVPFKRRMNDDDLENLCVTLTYPGGRWHDMSRTNFLSRTEGGTRFFHAGIDESQFCYVLKPTRRGDGTFQPGVGVRSNSNNHDYHRQHMRPSAPQPAVPEREVGGSQKASHKRKPQPKKRAKK